MIDLAYTYELATDTWDLELTEGVPDLVLANGTDEIDQRLRQCLRLFRGEWYLDQSLGVPYYEDILGIKGVSLEAIGQVMRAELLRQPDVIRIDSMTLDWDKEGRTLAVNFVAVTTDGTVPVTLEVP